MLRPRPPTTPTRVDPLRLQPRQQLVGEIDLLDISSAFTWRTWNRIDAGPGRGCPPFGSRLAMRSGSSATSPPWDSAPGAAAVEAVPDADGLPAQVVRRHGRTQDHRVQPRDVAGAHHEPMRLRELA